MSPFMKEFDHLRICLEVIKQVTNNFGDDHCIGKGGFGKVYRAEFQSVVAVKRLNRAYGQGDVEFWKEVMLLSCYRHENIISLVGFCDESEERILVYEYAPNKSLDLHLRSTNLTWVQRLKICLGAARGLQYLHDPKGGQQRVLHRDIKSANILLDENWNAKIADFGLSKFGPANQQYTFLVSNVVGTMGYIDPMSIETMLVTKESDVYSFGVVLFEVLCSRPCVDGTIMDGPHRVLPILAKKYYQEQKLVTIMDGNIRQQIKPACFDEFTAIAYKCLQTDREKRPSMDLIVHKLETALEQQVGSITYGLDDHQMGHRFIWTSQAHNGSLKQHKIRGSPYESWVSMNTPAPGPLDVYQNKNLDDLVTHKLALEKVISAINDETRQIIGIYGLGGVGKTTLAKEVASKMKNHFDDVAFTAVSQSLNVEKVQKDIEDATKKIMQGKKILIILDDVWEKLDLEELRIPCGTKHRNCKILLTSRSEDVCNKMNAQSKIFVDPLKKDETWILFKQVVGERIETDVTLKQVALEVSEECGGLPLLVQAVGNALKDKSIDLWKSALTRLKKHAPLEIDSNIKKAYTHLKLSYDYLHCEEARSCFLLCSMFPEDEKIFLEDLVYCWVGLAKFNNLESVNDARDMVRIAVNILTSSGLLLNMKNKNNTKMHDVVLDVALLIASEGNKKFLVKTGKSLSEWLPRYNTLESYTGISLMDNKICKLPDYEVHFPHLTTFLISRNELSTISNEFIGGMKEVRVVDMSWNRISSLPQSLKLLTKLRMLDLRGNESLHEISILGELNDLEILILYKTGIKEIPQEIGQLVNLRRFDVGNCKNLSRISEGVLSKLCRLEELRIGFYSMHGGIYGIMVEIMNLSKLTYLNLLVPCFDVIPEGFKWGKLNGFVIQGEGDQDMEFIIDFLSISERYLVLSIEDLKIPFVKSLTKLIEVNPNIILASVDNLNNILPDLYHEGFNKLESFALYKCPNVTSLVDTKDWDEFQTFDSSKDHLGNEGKTEQMFFTKLKNLNLIELGNLEVLWKCPDQYISFSNLVSFSIEDNNKLVRVFSVSVAQGLVSLHELTISRCRSLEEVIWGGDDEETANIIVFPSLANISFERLFKLKSFCYGNSTIKYPSLVDVKIKDCESMKKWGNGIQETPNLKFVNDVPILNEPDAINHAVVKRCKNELS